VADIWIIIPKLWIQNSNTILNKIWISFRSCEVTTNHPFSASLYGRWVSTSHWKGRTRPHSGNKVSYFGIRNYCKEFVDQYTVKVLCLIFLRFSTDVHKLPMFMTVISNFFTGRDFLKWSCHCHHLRLPHPSQHRLANHRVSLALFRTTLYWAIY